MLRDEAVVVASPASSEEYRQARAYRLFQEGHYPNPLGHAVVGCESCAEARRLAERLRALPSAGFDAFERPAFSRENDREEEQVEDSVSQVGYQVGYQGGAPSRVSMDVELPPSELEQAIQLLEGAVGAYEETLPSLWARFDPVLVQAPEAAEATGPGGEVPTRFHSSAAHRVEALVDRLHAATGRLVVFREAGQA